MSISRKEILAYALLILAAFASRFAIARFLPNDTPGDGKVYAQIARNVLEQHIFSHATEPPYEPSFIRLPGYPLFLAGIYAAFGHDNNTAVRTIQAAFDTITCALVALVAFLWDPDVTRKRQSSFAALALAAVCPFTAIYVATVLTETLTLVLTIAICVTTTLAFKTSSFRSSVLLWAATGVLAGVAVSFRPDSGLFVAAIGLTLIATSLPRVDNSAETSIWHRISRALILGTVFALAFCLVLLPWTIRNKRVFHVIQPLAPRHAEMPGEFVPRGYFTWLRTWLVDERYIEPVLWSLDQSAIKVDDFPDSAFDSAEEKERVAALLERYNHPSEAETSSLPDANIPATSGNALDTGKKEPIPPPQPGPTDQELDQSQKDQAESNEDSDEESQDQESQANEPVWVEMTPDVDAGFAEIASERIRRAPVRYYVLLPAKRAMNLWFDTHSQYYPFEGSLLPLEDLDYDLHQQFWLPLFVGLTVIYTWLGMVGGWFLWSSREFAARRWVLLCVLVIFLRLAFFSSLENPEPRYVVEFFPLLAILGGIALPRLQRQDVSEQTAAVDSVPPE